MVIRINTLLICCAHLFNVASAQPVHNNIEAHATANKLFGVKKNGDTLTVHLRNGKIKRYINKQDEDEMYSFIGSCPHTQYLLFRFEYRSGEISGFLLVNVRNGSQCSVPGKPILSPDKKRFAVSCVDLEAQYNPNSFSIYRLDNDSCRVEYSIEPTDWGVGKIKWLNNSSLSLFTDKFRTAKYFLY